MLMVDVDASAVERDLKGAALSCPQCKCELRPWGFARTRKLRRGGSVLEIRPRRSRCRQCTKTHVLLPVLALLRRVDLAEVIGKALMRKAQGAGHRTIATELSLPATTVREWLRRFCSKAELIRSHFTRLAVWLDSSIGPIEPRGSPVADALESIGLAAQAAASRLGNSPVWHFASGATGGELLSNTSSPFAASWQ